jgi:hypothetical protein
VILFASSSWACKKAAINSPGKNDDPDDCQVYLSRLPFKNLVLSVPFSRIISAG